MVTSAVAANGGPIEYAWYKYRCCFRAVDDDRMLTRRNEWKWQATFDDRERLLPRLVRKRPCLRRWKVMLASIRDAFQRKRRWISATVLRRQVSGCARFELEAT